MIDVVVVIHNPGEIAIPCLESLNEHDQGIGNIIIIDNASHKNYEAIQNNHLLYDTYVRLNNKVSLAEAWNIGMTMASSEIVVISNDDIIFTDGWASSLEKSMIDNKNIGVLQPFNTIGKLPDNFPYNYLKVDQVGDIPKSNFVGCCFAINRSIFQAVKEFDRRHFQDWDTYTYFYSKFYPFGCEDQDFYRRVRECGFQTLTDFGSYVHHYTGQTMKNISNFESVKTASDKLYTKRWKGVKL